MKIVTTIHLDGANTREDFLFAAKRFIDATALSSGRQPVKDSTRELAELLEGMVGRISAPFEFRVGAADAEPVIVVHPGTRKRGEAAKAKAVKEGDWVTDAYSVRK